MNPSHEDIRYGDFTSLDLQAEIRASRPPSWMPKAERRANRLSAIVERFKNADKEEPAVPSAPRGAIGESEG